MHQFKFHGKGKEYFGIWIVNILLSIITLGIYSAWAKVRTNKYFYGNTELNGSRFDYLAQPKQILIGRIIAVIAVIIWTALNAFSPQLAVLAMLVFALIYPVLVVRNLRFDMKMTQFRNVRFNFIGTYKSAYKVMLVKPLVAYIAIGISIAITLTYIMPASKIFGIIIMAATCLLLLPLLFSWVIAAMNQFIINNTRYGNLTFSATLQTTYIFKVLAKFMLLIVLIIAGFAAFLIIAGVSTNDISNLTGDSSKMAVFMIAYIGMIVGMIFTQVYFHVRVRNYILSATKLDNQLQPKSTMTVMSYSLLLLTNLLLIVCTLGLARPFTMIRHANYIASVTQVDGDLSLNNATDQITNESGAIADELSQAFDLGISAI
ncbi:YjgN family protein [Moritella viscosa]|uniref:Predicted membrane protein n=1 Tax=Moritella viscosa TaxID=80854 RepID=A0ABY1HIT2_9GAMM|nr:YjgN family protein [Moritella viscosa]CED60038.1 membrane protein [Moritella viscosa]SGY99572.1 Predicted membrane protein [Moritella viscosa]SGZ14576.1 Predicted membrane protein [Moritella viscosa]SHO15162.1 Predicted membrane protein [Moritella viscosa]SHO23714.1 Predicted membrane protein [Moritella viscosa]